MCAYGQNNRNCLNPTETLHEEKDKQLLLDHHNAYRYLYASRFLNQSTSLCKIGFLKWDKELEAKAKEWGKSCPFVKKFCPPQENIEQSVDILHDNEPPTSNLSVFFKNWFKPLEQMADKEEEAVLKSWQPGAWNKATLALWAKTERVGCSFIVFTSKDPKLIEHFCLIKANQQHFKMLICNYSPPGNVHGGEVIPLTCGAKPEPRPPPPRPDDPVVVPGVNISEVVLPDVPLPPDAGDEFINVSALNEPTVNPHSSSRPLFSFANIPYILASQLVTMKKVTVLCLLILSGAVWLDLVSAGSGIIVAMYGALVYR
ncbi:hypothetical protein GE061_003263 [Apolygus lucorum]|uniref:SCP domain-containing protein n=1 Tax=Apolygus lucorum TaxID=248454 RepID=A0A8S9X3B2_APOLU|nr:hypothetical protein GE061_003263 [Apolygus lucorum]